LAFLLGGIVAVFWAAGADYFDRARRGDEQDYQEFTKLLHRVHDEIKQRFRSVPSHASSTKMSEPKRQQ
jgi:hypothetical protein